MKKDLFINFISSDRINLAFELLKKGKIGRKDPWIISRLEYGAFLKKSPEKRAEEKIVHSEPGDELKILNEFIKSGEYLKY